MNSVQVEVTAETPQQKSLPDRMGIDGVKNIVAVSSGKGGVGKSTVAVNLAVSLAQAGAAVGLIDADIYGPNAPTMMGLSAAEVRVRQGAEGQGEVLEPAFNHWRQNGFHGLFVDPDSTVDPAMGPMLNDDCAQIFVTRWQWGELDYLIVDMPPGTGDAQLTLAQAVPMAGAVIVSTPQDVAVSDARRGLRMFQQLKVPVLGVVENMSFFIPPDAPEKRYDIFWFWRWRKNCFRAWSPPAGMCAFGNVG